MTQNKILSTQRQTLRKELRQRRNGLSRAEQQLAAQKLFLRLSRNSHFRNAKNILFYWPNDGEISPLPLLKYALKKRKNCYLPIINNISQKFICHRYQRGEKLRKNIFGIPEPLHSSTNMSADQLDLVLMPLVGFDPNGNRLGMGGGFYDRTFAQLRNHKPLRFGLAHSLQKVTQLDNASWDISMHAICTEKNFYRIRRH